MADEYWQYRLVFYKILGPLVTAFGILGNLFCLLALSHRNYKVQKSVDNVGNAAQRNNHGMKSYMYSYIQGLAWADLAYLAFNLQSCYFGSKPELIEEYRGYLFNVLQPTWNAFKATSDFIVICMTSKKIHGRKYYYF